jgi:hypothetical protein
MNFNYRDFFIHNDDLHIIKEQLSIVDEAISKKDALSTNAKAVWDMYNMYKKEPSGTDGSSGSSGSSGTSGTDGSSGSNEPKIEQKIADKLDINLSTVQKIIQICLMKATDDKITSHLISDKLGINEQTVFNVLKNAIGSDFKRQKDTHFVNDAVKIYNLHNLGKTPEQIVDLVNSEKKENFEKIDLNKVNTVLKIVDMAKKQMTEKGEVNIQEIYREIVYKISGPTIAELIKKLNLGKPRYSHVYTVEQDAFILYNYLQRTPIIKIAELFNKEFSTKSNQLDIKNDSISKHIKTILKPKGESEISEYVLDLLNRYKTKYFSTVNINDDETKDLLTHYTAPERIKGKDTTGTGTNRDMSAHLGTLPKNFNTMITNLVS